MALPVPPPKLSATAPSVVRSPSGLVDRAAAILARQTAAPVSPRSVDGQRHAAEAIDDLRQRAMALALDLGRLVVASQPALAPGAPSRALDFAAEAAGTVPWRRPAIAASPGGSTSLQLKLENLEDRPVTISLFSSELLSEGGRDIPARAISFDPEPLNIGPRQQAVVSVRVAVPSHALPGAYSGLVQAVGLPGIKAVITVEVS